MSRATLTSIIIIVVLLVVLGIYFMYSGFRGVGGPTSEQQQQANTIGIGPSSNLGSVLTDASGKTLYYFAKDVPGQSNCTGDCLQAWPEFYIEQLSIPEGLEASDFAKITRSDNKGQTLYKGWPLYYYSGDKNAADAIGDNKDNLWFAARYPFYNIVVMDNGKDGAYLADAKGMALYYYNGDTKGNETISPKSNCTGACMDQWQIFDQKNIIAPSLLPASSFYEFDSQGNSKQLSYKGRPLYRFKGDKNPGDVSGASLDGKWSLAKP